MSNLGMGSSGKGGRREVAVKLTLAALFLCTAGSITCAYLTLPNGLYETTGERLALGVASASPFVFLCACVLVFRRPRFGYGFGLAAGLIALPWFACTELSLPTGVSSWIVLNLADGAFPGDKELLVFAKLKILAVALMATSIVWSALRLLPARVLLRHSPLCQRTWPAFAVSGLLLVVWFLTSVTPYRVPIISDGVAPELRILHVEKHWPRFHETSISVFRDGRFAVWRNDRRLFQYRFEGRLVEGALPQSACEHARALAQSPELLTLHTRPAKALRSWTGEGWYVVIGDSRPLAFAHEDRTAPPREVTDLFHEIEKLPATREGSWAVQDACLGFCYDPVAALNPRR